MTTDQEAKGPGWNRQQITFWLSPRRRKNLMAIAKDLPPGASPSDALASAIDLALGGRMAAEQFNSDELVDSIDSAVACGFADARKTMESQGRAIEEMAASLRSIHALIAAVAGEDVATTECLGAAPARPLPPGALRFRDWLEASLARAGSQPQRSAVARASWRGVERDSEL